MSVRHNRDGRTHDKEYEFILGMVIIIHARTKSIHAAAPSPGAQPREQLLQHLGHELEPSPSRPSAPGLPSAPRAPPAFASPAVVFDL